MGKKIIVVVDVQNDFVSGSLGSPWAMAVTEKIATYLEEASKDKNVARIIATRDTHCNQNTINEFGIPADEFSWYLNTFEGKKLPIEHCIRDTWGWEIVPSVDKFVHQRIDKPTFMSVWLAKQINVIMAGRTVCIGEEIDEIELFGFCTSICVISNALYLRGLYPSMKITVKEDLCADISPEAHISACNVLHNCQMEVKIPTLSEIEGRIRYFNRHFNHSDDEIRKEFFELLLEERFNVETVVGMNDNTTFRELGFDSLDEIEFVMAVEDNFDIAIGDEEVSNCKTIGDALKIIKEKLAKS